MNKLVEDFEKYLRNNQLKMTREHLNHLFVDLKLIFITQNNINNYLANNSIIICDPKIIVIDQCKLTEKYFVICNNKTIVMILESEFHLLKLFFEQNKDSDLLFLTKNARTCFESIIKETKFQHISVIDTFMSNEICNLSENFSGKFQITEKKFISVWEKIRNSFSGYLIKKMHLQNNVDRIRYSKKYFYPEFDKINLKEDE